MHPTNFRLSEPALFGSGTEFLVGLRNEAQQGRPFKAVGLPIVSPTYDFGAIPVSGIHREKAAGIRKAELTRIFHEFTR